MVDEPSNSIIMIEALIGGVIRIDHCASLRLITTARIYHGVHDMRLPLSVKTSRRAVLRMRLILSARSEHREEGNHYFPNVNNQE